MYSPMLQKTEEAFLATVSDLYSVYETHTGRCTKTTERLL